MSATAMQTELFDIVEPALCAAREALAQGAEGDAAARAGRAGVLLLPARVLLTIARESGREAYQPATRVQSLEKALPAERCMVDAPRVRPCAGDPEQVLLMAKILALGIRLDEDSALLVQLSEEPGVPAIELSLDGPGDIPDAYPLGANIEVDLPWIGERWTAATRGGRIDRVPNGLVLRLEGQRALPERPASSERLLEVVKAAHQAALRAAASGGKDDLRDAREAVESALKAGRGEMQAEQADVNRVVRQTADVFQEALEKHSIRMEFYPDRNVPPISMIRSRLTAAASHVFRYAKQSLPRGGGVAVRTAEDPADRNLTTGFAVTGLQAPVEPAPIFAALRSIAEELHGGRFEHEALQNGVSFSLHLPDVVGRDLDEWLPGWDIFTERSRQALRVALSGQMPPDVILPGILDEESEHWLLPLLTSPGVVNRVRDRDKWPDPLPPGNASRRDKALGQVAKGKPKKEVVRPPHAGDLLWPLADSPPIADILGLSRLQPDEVRALCMHLLQEPPAALEALRLIARVRSIPRESS